MSRNLLRLPDYYFRLKDNGALVFQVITDERSQRLELNHIANVNLRKAEFRASGTHELTQQDEDAISEWITERTELEEERQIDDLLRAVDYLNTTTHWLQSLATDDQVERVANPLLLAMHDLRTVLLRRRTSALSGD